MDLFWSKENIQLGYRNLAIHLQVRAVWNGHPFRNLIDNGSAEQGALRVRPAIDRGTSKFLSHFGTLSSIFSTLGDLQGTGWYYSSTFWTMFRTFWASVAADKFNLPGRYPNDFLFLLTILGLAGSAAPDLA